MSLYSALEVFPDLLLMENTHNMQPMIPFMGKKCVCVIL